MLNEDTIDTMVRTARNARNNAYGPYSETMTGACVLASDGTLYGGCNVENSSLGLSMCAERVAIFKAVSDGKQGFDDLAVIGDTEEPYIPCGAYLQVIREFNIPELVLANLEGDIRVVNIEEISSFFTYMGTNPIR